MIRKPIRKIFFFIVLFSIFIMSKNVKAASYTLLVNNVDDRVMVYVNEKQVANVSYQKSVRTDITPNLHIGANDVTFKVYNDGVIWNYGVEILLDGKSLFRDYCGALNNNGCRNNDKSTGMVYSNKFRIMLDPPPVKLLIQRLQIEKTMGTRLARIGSESCITGKLFIVERTYGLTFDPLSLGGRIVGDTLELDYRNNLESISSIPPGLYTGFVREGGPKGWRIELTVPQRPNIQIHIGNNLSNTIGCILLGDKNGPCSVISSDVVMQKLRSEIDKYSVLPPVEIRITGP